MKESSLTLFKRKRETKCLFICIVIWYMVNYDSNLDTICLHAWNSYWHLASGISIWSVIIVAKICGIVRDQVADFCQSLCRGFSWVFSCYELTMFFDPSPSFNFFFFELYMVKYVLSLGPWKLHTQEFHWSRRKNIGKKKHFPFENQRYWLGWRYCISL